MFWESVTLGLSSLLHWQTYVATALFLLLSLGPLLIIGFISSRSVAAGVLTGFASLILMPLVQVFALAVFILTLSPILLGLSDEAAWALPWVLVTEDPWFVIKVVGKLTVGAFLLALIPIIGRLHSLYTILIGSFALAIFLGVLGGLYPQVSVQHIAFWPGFWFACGLIFIGSVMAWIGSLCASLLATVAEAWIEGLGQIIMAPIGALFGFLPLFIYAAWIGQQVRIG